MNARTTHSSSPGSLRTTPSPAPPSAGTGTGRRNLLVIPPPERDAASAAPVAAAGRRQTARESQEYEAGATSTPAVPLRGGR